MKHLFVLSVTSFLFLSGKPVKHLSPSGNEEALTAYFTSSLEKEQLPGPRRQLYKVKFRAAEISRYREMAWQSWKKANAARLASWTAVNDNAGRDSLTWDLPDDRRMLFSLRKKGARPENGFPLFINLHGGGCFPNEAGPWTSKANNSEWKAAKLLGEKYDDAPSLYFIPRMPDDRRGRWYHRAPMTAYIRAWQLGVLSGDIDPDRVYITGISEGGYGSFRAGVFFADYFAGVGPMAGPVRTIDEPVENLRNTPICIEVGEFDRAYDRAANGRNWKKLLDSAAENNKGQFRHLVDIQAGKGHGIDYTRTTPWLKQFKRDAYPDTLSLVYYSECDTIRAEEPGQPCTYRKGFAYLRLDGLSQTGERSFYMEKKENTYKITSTNRKGAVNGSIKLYADEIDFSLPVQVIYNGRSVFNGKLTPNLGTMAESLALFGDPRRIFAASVTVRVED